MQNVQSWMLISYLHREPNIALLRIHNTVPLLELQCGPTLEARSDTTTCFQRCIRVLGMLSYRGAGTVLPVSRARTALHYGGRIGLRPA